MAQRSLGQYLLALVMHPEILQQYLNDPEPVIKKSGLSPANKKILRSNDLNKVLKQLRREVGPDPGDVLLP